MEKSRFIKKIKKFKKIAIISHDAGGAEILSSLCGIIKKHKRYFLQGPAINIFNKNLRKKILVDKKENIISWADLILTSTSVNSDLEKKFIHEGLLRNKTVICVLDHWVKYKSRFIFKKKLLKPSEIWTTDKESQILAKKIFKRKIFLLTNPYIERLKNKKSKKKNNKYLNFVFASDNVDGINKTGYDFKIFKKFLIYFNKIASSKPKRLFIKTHPSEKSNKYDNIIKLLNIKILKINKNFNIKNFDYVAGHQSMLIAAGKQLGLKTINIKIKKTEEILLPKKYIDISI